MSAETVIPHSTQEDTGKGKKRARETSLPGRRELCWRLPATAPPGTGSSFRLPTSAAIHAPRRRGYCRIRFFLLRRPPEQYAVTSTNHARPLELALATELASAAALAPTVALVPASPTCEEAARSHYTRPPRPAALQPGRAAAAPAHPAAQPRVRALPPGAAAARSPLPVPHPGAAVACRMPAPCRRTPAPPTGTAPPAPSPMCFRGVEE